MDGSTGGWRGIPRGIWALGMVSLLMDVSSEMIHALLPVYLVVGLGSTALTVGLIEGIAEATANVTKVFSGALSDWLGRRKVLAALGYGLAAVTKPVFPLAPTVGWLVAARFIDRVGKGLRGAPRDAMIADMAPEGARGAAFGLRQSLDTTGAFLGPMLAIALMWATADNFRAVFWVAVLPAVLSFLVIALVVREPARPAGLRRVRTPLARAELRRLGRAYWGIVGLACLFTLARFSEAFLVLKAQSLGVELMLVPMVLVVLNIVYSLAAYPAGVLSDRVGKRGLLSAAVIALGLADVVLAAADGMMALWAGVALWGLHLGLSQGLLAALVAETAPAELRGTAFGMFNLATGVALLLASVGAGGLWQAAGPGATFLAGAVLAGLTLLALTRMPRGTARSPGAGKD
ncbi:MAG: MFS transporter [Limimaricola sp.]|uniref:MFS transporter n=1 Tax=Limimaricola sp. TaxID=2211665 RepID=UPI001DC83C65|nr:MFS transporter [Limimaricola sp.]MBI1417577.1 MFS transporter [Limimaricola sp.]